MRTFIQEGLEQNIIRASNATHYSQVYLVVKPSGDNGSANAEAVTKAPRKWRTTIDYRFLNQCLVPQHWPLPNISQMLDMTSGYWQAPLAENSKRFTAFITFMGIFEWNRAPMGIQPAGGYFHYCISFIVLTGLMYIIVESYIDDILILGQTKEQFFINVRKVFERFKTFRITFNPHSCFDYFYPKKLQEAYSLFKY